VPVPARSLTEPPFQTQITVTVPSTLTTGTYPIRVEVDGAHSKLTLDTNSGSPTFGQYLPQVEVSA